MDAQEQKECDASESGSLPAPVEHLHGLRLWIVGFGLVLLGSNLQLN